MTRMPTSGPPLTDAPPGVRFGVPPRAPLVRRPAAPPRRPQRCAFAGEPSVEADRLAGKQRAHGAGRVACNPAGQVRPRRLDQQQRGQAAIHYKPRIALDSAYIVEIVMDA